MFAIVLYEINHFAKRFKIWRNLSLFQFHCLVFKVGKKILCSVYFRKFLIDWLQINIIKITAFQTFSIVFFCIQFYDKDIVFFTF